MAHLAALYDAEFRERYDSIYILEEKTTNFVHDTVWIKDKSTEYRYRYLRDTAFVEKTDTVVVIKEVERRDEQQIVTQKTRPRNWLDYLSYASLLLLLVMFFFRIRSPTR